MPHDEALRIRDDVGFFQAVRAVLAKSAPGERKTDEELDHAIRQIVSRAVASDEVVDIFAAAGLQEAGHLDPLRRVPGRGARHAAAQPRRRAAAEAAERRDQDARRKRNVVQARSFAEMLEQSLRRYQNRAIETAQVIEELIELAKEMRAAERARRGARPDRGRAGLLRRAGDQRQRRQGARRRDAARRSPASWSRPSATNVTIDWTVRENVRAQLRVHREAHPAQARLPAGQAGEGDADGAGAGRGALRSVGGRMRRGAGSPGELVLLPVELRRHAQPDPHVYGQCITATNALLNAAAATDNTEVLKRAATEAS